MTNKHIEITIEDFNAMRDRIAELEHNNILLQQQLNGYIKIDDELWIESKKISESIGIPFDKNNYKEMRVATFNAYVLLELADKIKLEVLDLRGRLDICKQYFLLDTLGSIDEVLKRFKDMCRKCKVACGIEVKPITIKGQNDDYEKH